MNYSIATDEQLKTIINSDKGCPADLLGGVTTEMVKRKLLIPLIIHVAKKMYRNVDYVVKHVLQMEWKDLIQIGHIEILKQSERFKTGMRTPKTFYMMCLITKLGKLKRDAEAEKRKSNIGVESVDELDEKIQEKIFQSPINIERYVIRKITLEDAFKVLQPIERKAIELYHYYGLTQYETAERLGFNRTSGNRILNRAYKKLRGELIGQEPSIAT